MIAALAVCIWFFAIFWLFANRTPASAVASSIVGGYLLLPESFRIDLPGAPTLNKSSITALTTFLAATLLLKGTRIRGLPDGTILPGWMPRSRAAQILLIGLVIGIAGMVVTNGDPLRYGSLLLPGLRLYDMVAMIGNVLISLLPFLLARKYLAHPDAQIKLLVVLAVAGLLYSLPALYEIRMSPQLSRMIYGYFPHDWAQHLRAGGFRPVVFLHHGLWLSIFFCSAFLAAMALWRSSSGQIRWRWMLASGWLFMTLVLSKSLGALGIGILLGAVILFLPVRLQVLTAAALAAVVLTYPLLRGAGMIPVDTLTEFARGIEAERANSLGARLHNEDSLLTKANERPLFGWGTWGRNRVYDSDGNNLSITDGYWIISIGGKGWAGYLSEMGLLTVPLILLGLRWRSLALAPAAAGVALALTANLIDLIPNATLTPVTWLLAGSLAGRLELGRLPEARQVPDGDILPARRNGYSRQTRRHQAHVVN